MQRRPLSLAFSLILVLLATGYDASPADAQGRSVLRNQTRNTVRAVTSQVRKLVKPKLVVKRGATGAVTGLALSADDKMLLTILEDKTARLWDLQIGRELRAFQFGKTGIRSGQMSPDGKRVVLALEDGSVRLIESETGKALRTLSGHRGAVLAMAISADGTTLATGGSDGSLRSWDMASGQPLQVYEGHKKGILSVAISADNRHLASGGADKTARLWSAAGGDPIQIFGKHTSAVTGVAFGADGSSVITGSKDRVIRVWNLSDAKEKATFRGSEGAVLTVQVSDQGEFVVAGGEDNTIRMWDLRSGDLVKTMEGHAGAVRTVLFDLGEKRLLSASDDGTTKIWDVQSGAVFAQMISTVAGWAVVDRDGRFDGTENAFEDVQWEAASQSLELDSFSEQYYEPGLLAKHMRDDNNFINEGVSAVPEGIFLPPSTSFDGQITAEPGPDGRIEVRVIARDEGGRVTGVRLMHNDRLVPAGQITADETETNNRGLETRRVTYRVVPVVGENVFEAVGIGEGDIEGEPAVAQVTLAGQQRKPRLHLLVVGINEYAADELTLDYAKPDAFAILNALSKTGKGLYSEIIGYQLVDRFATRSAILESPGLDECLAARRCLGRLLCRAWHCCRQGLVLLADRVQLGLL